MSERWWDGCDCKTCLDLRALHSKPDPLATAHDLLREAETEIREAVAHDRLHARSYLGTRRCDDCGKRANALDKIAARIRSFLPDGDKP